MTLNFADHDTHLLRFIASRCLRVLACFEEPRLKNVRNGEHRIIDVRDARKALPVLGSIFPSVLNDVIVEFT